MKIKHINLLVLKPLFLCFALLQTVSCWDGLNDMLEEGESPSAITFTQSSLTSGGMSINWTDPASVTGYDHVLVTYTPGSSFILNKGVTTFNVSGLSSSTEYTVTVQAIGKENIVKAQSSFKVTPSGAYTLSFIYTAADLDSVRSNLGYYYLVMNDIDLSGYPNWIPIGTADPSPPDSFTGVFDCQNHRINSMTINRNQGLLGLFGRVDGVVKNCMISGSITGTLSGSYIGGIVGETLTDGAIINCCGMVFITATGANSRLGGIVGCCSNPSNVVSSCYATGKVVASGATSNAGGLAGLNQGTISNSYATGSVSGTYETGGLVGANYNAAAIINNCYAVGQVSGGTLIGGLVGSNSGTCTASYYDSQTTGQSDDTGKGFPRTTNQMKLADTYSGWDFTAVWGISSVINGGYPYLRDVAP